VDGLSDEAGRLYWYDKDADPNAPVDRADMSPVDALDECLDLWASGAWPDENAAANLGEVMGYVGELLEEMRDWEDFDPDGNRLTRPIEDVELPD
jgi:hypothetical protein